MITPKHILISRTDSIGDVILTLPLCAALKERFPNSEILFLGKSYTKDVIQSFTAIDTFLDWSELGKKTDSEIAKEWKTLNIDTVIHVFPNKRIGQIAKLAAIPNRIGTSHRFHHWLTCTIRPNFTRKKSELHESQLNYKLAEKLGIGIFPTLETIQSTTHYFQPKKVDLPASVQTFINTDTPYYILHPKSQGSALEWPIEKYISLANQLIKNGKKVIFTGTEKEGELFRKYLPKNHFIFDSTGLLTLQQLIYLISNAAGLVACSTGPLHIAAFCGIKTVGLFSSRKPIHPGRWQPIGHKAIALVYDAECKSCQKGDICKCIENISIDTVYKHLI